VEQLGREAIERAVSELFPGATIRAWTALSPDAGGGIAQKGAGYGRPMRIDVEDASGARRALVLRTATPDVFGHDRRADRAAELILAHDTFPLIPDHVAALDVGLIAPEGLRSLRGAGEPYLLTTFAEGELYVEDLRRIAREGVATPLDLARCGALARWLVRLHREPLAEPVAWRRAIRDLLGHGEGIFGIADAYPDDVPGGSPRRLAAIERRCLSWRWRLRGRVERLRRTHGDFHPFNIVFQEGTRFTALDASRGCCGDPADDVVALSVNYVFLGLQAPAAWPRGFGPLWRAFWATYLEGAGRMALESAAPFLAWRALVLGCPRFYPGLAGPARDSLLGFAERALQAPELDPGAAERLFQ
jgi:aminoglycoside phosphotransferase (APT) family kinase protein